MSRSAHLRSAPLAIATFLAACSSGGGTPTPAMPDPFDVNVHGFGFQNFTNTQPVQVTNLTPADMHRMFGDAACGSGTGPTCTLSPQAQQWMEMISEAMNGGHCEGMAVLSLNMYLGRQSPTDFGAPTTNALTLAGNEPLQREIGYWFALQAVAPTSMSRIPGTPVEQADRLRTSFMGNGERYTIAIFKSDFTGGHAVTPYDVRDEDGRTRIVVYDNNFPGQERFIDIDPAANTWQYEAAANPGNPASLYTGDATKPTLLLVPISAREAARVCPFCGDLQMGGARTIATTGDASVLISNGSGQRLGHMGDTLVEEIPGAEVVALTSDDLWNDQSEPLYRLPGGGDLTVELSAEDTASPSSVSSSGPGYYLGVENVQLEPGQNDRLLIGGDSPYIEYETSGMETADVVLAIQTSAADWTVSVRSRGDSAGQLIQAGLSVDDGMLDVSFGGADAMSEFDLTITRADGGTELAFSHANIPVPNGALVTLDYGSFDTDGEMLVLSIDTDGDGTPESTVDLLDEP